MASLSKDQHGSYRILFINGYGKRKTIRPGRLNAKQAQELKLKVEHLNAIQIAQLPPDAELARWLSQIGDDLARKFAAVGLMPARQSSTLGDFLNGYLESRAMDSKPNTISNLKGVANELQRFFGPNTQLRTITPVLAESFMAHYHERGLAPTTIYRQLKFAKQFFGIAVKRKLIASNPFADVRGKSSTQNHRLQYVTVEEIQAVLQQANLTFQVIIALSRFAGMRCPSEVMLLRWEDVDLARGRMMVTSPKTEHIEGRGTRITPITPKLRPYLEQAKAIAEPEDKYVVGGIAGQRYRDSAATGWRGTNLRSTMTKYIFRAGLVPWPKIFHNLRASCETDFARHHPIHVVTAWLGNTPKIALNHYLQTQEADFDKAVRGQNESAESDASRRDLAHQTAQSPEGKVGQEQTQTAKIPRKVALVATDGQYCPTIEQTKDYTRQELNL